MSIWSWLKLTAGLWLLRKAVRIAPWLLLVVVAIVAWPLTLVTAAGYVTAWRRGWPPARLRRAAAWALTGAGVWLLAAALRFRAWRTAARARIRDWQDGWPRVGALFARHWDHFWPHAAAPAAARAFVLLAPATVPAGLGLAALLWAWRKYAITTGLAGITASAPITFDARQWRRQVGTAKDLTEAPGAVPLLGRGGRIPVGGTIRAVACRWQPVFTLPAAACARHMVIIGATGSGKTNLMMRLWAGWFTAALDAHVAGTGDRPLLIVLDCKGGRDACPACRPPSRPACSPPSTFRSCGTSRASRPPCTPRSPRRPSRPSPASWTPARTATTTPAPTPTPASPPPCGI